MNAIIGMTHIVRREITEGANAERLARVSDAASHLLQLIDSVLDMSKIEAGKLVLDEVEFELDALLERVFNLVSEASHRKKLELVLSLDQVPSTLRGDPVRISQMLVNLLDNAIKFTEQGTIELHATAVERHGKEVSLRFSVRDTGPGIPADLQARVFDLFEQGDNSRTRTAGGTGLGLAITRELARLMGGDAGVDSEPGAGSSFWVTVRLFDETPAVAPRTQSLASGPRVLLVDDSPEAREAVGRMLRDLGLPVDVAASGTDALAMAIAAQAEGQAFDVMVVDTTMPGMDGLETVRQVSRRLSRPPRVILIGPSGDLPSPADAQALGITAALRKPATPSTLREHVAASHAGRDAQAHGSGRAPGLEQALRDRHAGTRVLLAEDNPVNAEVALALLEEAGFAVHVAHNGSEAVAAAASAEFALVLMDIQMPVLDGIAATRALRAQPQHTRTPIIAMTAHAHPEERESALSAGMDDYLTKPVKPARLYAVLDKWLGPR